MNAHKSSSSHRQVANGDSIAQTATHAILARSMTVDSLLTLAAMESRRRAGEVPGRTASLTADIARLASIRDDLRAQTAAEQADPPAGDPVATHGLIDAHAAVAAAQTGPGPEASGDDRPD